MADCIAIIPARYTSERLPGKALADLGGMSMLERVYRRVEKCNELDRIIVATDDERIEAHALTFGAEVAMTFRSHRSGSDRCAEVARIFWSDAIILNVQGDEPFIAPELVDEMALKMKEDDWLQILTCRTVLTDRQQIEDPSVVKLVCDLNGRAMYFSRMPIPFARYAPTEAQWYKHIGLYGFRNKTLQELSTLKATALEMTEGLEQLRWMEHNYSIHVIDTGYQSFGIDTPEDLKAARERLSSGLLSDQ